MHFKQADLKDIPYPHRPVTIFGLSDRPEKCGFDQVTCQPAGLLTV